MEFGLKFDRAKKDLLPVHVHFQYGIRWNDGPTAILLIIEKSLEGLNFASKGPELLFSNEIPTLTVLFRTLS